MLTEDFRHVGLGHPSRVDLGGGDPRQHVGNNVVGPELEQDVVVAQRLEDLVDIDLAGRHVERRALNFVRDAREIRPRSPTGRPLPVFIGADGDQPAPVRHPLRHLQLRIREEDCFEGRDSCVFDERLDAEIFVVAGEGLSLAVRAAIPDEPGKLL
ncbi:hypothetical protein [Aurantimonas sp. A2-1-M11]|uniref:hypothetical protein n=1 Tax=Aurantimonas sp. A2-1-M11 TaxID=3113712 RepID=UPI002F92886B